MEALGIGPGDEVIVPGFTFYATWLAVTQLGATPVAVDVDLDSASLNISCTREAITDRTKAIIVVHLYGIPADLAALRRLADEAGIYLVEDAAQSHGSKSRGSMTGSVGDFASFSFYPTKNLGALGDGGAIVTNNQELASVARRRRSYGQGASKYEHIDSGWNSRLDSLQAAFLSGELPNLEARNRRRNEVASRYLQALGTRADSVIKGFRQESVWHQFVLRSTARDKVREHFSRLGVATDVHYPYHFNSVEPLAEYRNGTPLPHSKALSDEVVSLPISPWLTADAVARVVEGLETLHPGLVAGD
jgi:dTDP-4-amino-4,6-dideoxygalactose transaminase